VHNGGLSFTNIKRNRGNIGELRVDEDAG